MSTPPPILSTRELYRLFETDGAATPVLRGVDLSVTEGEFVCVMGPSGSGKSTLLHLVCGLDRPSSGTIELAGQPLEALSEAARTRLRRDQVGFVFQFFNLMPNLSVLENVALPLTIQGLPLERGAEQSRGLLERLGLAARAGAFPHQLSGGEMQRTSIARALAAGQPLLLCDEPTGNLSQSAGAEVMQILRKLRDEDGRTILLVTHNPRDATFADRVLFLVDGALAPGVELRRPDLSVEAVHAALGALQI